MPRSAAIVLAGGNSARMGAPKAGLDWHGSSLLRRISGLVGRAVDGPVIVVRAPAQELPELAPNIEVACDARRDRGPLEGLHAGLVALAGRTEAVYVSSTDVPLLHPVFVRRVLGALSDQLDVVLPVIAGHRQPLAAAYRTDLLDPIAQLLADGQLAPRMLFEHCRAVTLDERELLRDPELDRLDPELDSLLNLNDPAAYERARLRPAPEVEIAYSPAAGDTRTGAARAWTLADAVNAAGTAMVAGDRGRLLGDSARIIGDGGSVLGDGGWVLGDSARIIGGGGASVGGELVRDTQFPLVAGDRVVLRRLTTRPKHGKPDFDDSKT